MTFAEGANVLLNVLTIVSVVGTAFYFLGQIKSTIAGLTEAVEKLNKKLDGHEEKISNHQDRLTRLEAVRARAN